LLSFPVRDGRYDIVAAAGAFSNPLNASNQMQAVIERHRIQVNDVAGFTVEVPEHDWFTHLDEAFSDQHPRSPDWDSNAPMMEGPRNR
jgi:hypothetical protein